MADFHTDFDKFTTLIQSNTPFAFSRYADGEVALMKGIPIGMNSQAYNQDKWTAPAGITKVGIGLLESLQHTEPNYYYAISSDTDSIDDKSFLLSYIKTSNITFANLWINANYQKMKSFYEHLNKSVYVICNHTAKKSSFPFCVDVLFPFPDDCINYWELYGNEYIESLTNYSNQLNNKTFFVSAGPVSEILIHKMFINNPNNQYIDVGSSLDEFIHGAITRPYMNIDSQYSTEISRFYE